MKIFSRLFLSYTLILGSLMPYVAKAEEKKISNREMARMLMSPVESFNAEFNRSGLYVNQGFPLDGRVTVNEYRLLGLTDLQDMKNVSLRDDFRAAIRTNNFLLDGSVEDLKSNPRYQSMLNTNEGRRALLRMYNGSFASLSVVTGENLAKTKADLFGQIRQQVFADASINDADPEVKNQKRNLEIQRRLLGEFSDVEKMEAKKRILRAKSTLTNPVSRAKYNYANGFASGKIPPKSASLSLSNQFANVRGKMVIRVQDPFGKDVDVSIAKDAKHLGEKAPNGTKFSQQIKSGIIQTGLIGLALGVVFLGATELAMINDYEDNPKRFEQNLEQMANPALYTSIFSFFVGGALTDATVKGGANFLDVSRRSKANILSLIQNKSMFVNDPALRSEFIRKNMAAMKSASFLSRATSYTGMTGGFLISQLVFKYHNKLRSCGQVMDLQSGRYTPTERQQIQQACDQTFSQITQEILASPETWTQLVGMLSAKAILTFGMSRAQMARYAFTSRTQSAAALRASSAATSQEVRIASRGLMNIPKVGIALGSTVGGFILFSVIFWAVMEGLNWGVGRLTLNVPATQAAANIRELFKLYQEQGWDMDLLCDDRNLLQGSLWDYFKPLAFWADTNKCGEELISAFMANHTAVNQNWRQSIRGPIDQSIASWSDFTFKATNLQQASYLFYKDIAEQIKAQRNSGRELVINKVFNSSTNAREALGYANTHLYNHPLPLFRSEPYFGWSYKLKEDSVNLNYPRYSGVGTNWVERFNTRNGVDDLTARKNKFISDVLPEVIPLLEERELSVEAPREKKEINRILGYLKHKNRNGVQTLPQVARGLHLIASKMENVQSSKGCHVIEGCFWLDLQKKFFDTDLWTDDKNGFPQFKEGQTFYAGYQTSQNRPLGVKPIGPGQEFFVNYIARLGANHNIDAYYFPEGYQSMVDYMLKQMVCGVDVKNGEKMIVKKWYDSLPTWMGQRQSPEFKAPRISLKPGFDPCYGDPAMNAFRQYGPPGGSTFYNYMEDVNDPSKTYGGIVEFLYKHADDDFVQDFEGWWKRYVSGQYAEVIDGLARIFNEEVIDQKLNEAIVRNNTDNNCFEYCREFSFAHKDGIAAALKQEMDTYNTYLFSPLIKDMTLDLDYVEITDEKEARQKISEDFTRLRAEIYDIFLYASDRTPRLTIPALIEEYNDVLAEVSAEASVQNPEVSSNYEIVKLRALKALLAKKDYEIRILTRTEENDSTGRAPIFNIMMTALSLLNEMDHLTEAEKEEITYNITINTRTLEQEFESMANRDGKVIFDYQDWPGDQPGATEEDQDKPSPTLLTVSKAHHAIFQLMDELFELQAQKILFKK